MCVAEQLVTILQALQCLCLQKWLIALEHIGG